MVVEPAVLVGCEVTALCASFLEELLSRARASSPPPSRFLGPPFIFPSFPFSSSSSDARDPRPHTRCSWAVLSTPALLLRFNFQLFSCDDRMHVASGAVCGFPRPWSSPPCIPSRGDTHSQLYQTSHVEWPGLPVGTCPVVLTPPGSDHLGLDFLAIFPQGAPAFSFFPGLPLFLSGRRAVWCLYVGCGLAWPSEAYQ